MFTAGIEIAAVLTCFLLSTLHMAGDYFRKLCKVAFIKSEGLILLHPINQGGSICFQEAGSLKDTKVNYRYSSLNDWSRNSHLKL